MNIKDLIISFFEKTNHGCLRLELPDNSTTVFGVAEDSMPVDLKVHDERFFKRVALKGDIGLGESYIDGDWDSSDPAALLGWFLKNKEVLMSDRFEWAMPMISRLASLQERIGHLRNSNTRTGSKRNIEAHYDLGNDFYELFLDSSMTYSSAFFRSEEDSLTEAQHEKYDRICRKLNLMPGDSVLEIGCGWGGFAVYAAKNYGCTVTGITLSPSQYDYTLKRVADNGLEDQINIKLIDYRDMIGTFDKVVSIEMIEAVGHEHLNSYFAAIDRLLKPDGLSCIQIIMSADQRYKTYCKTSDFIRKHIFPGSHLPAISSLFDAKGKTDLNLYHMESFGLHYAKTLELWREQFEANWSRIKELGFPEEFRRKWRMYFDYCIAGFKERHINVAQVVFGRMNCETYTFETSTFSGSQHTENEARLVANG